MDNVKQTYDELKTRLDEAERLIAALTNRGNDATDVPGNGSNNLTSSTERGVIEANIESEKNFRNSMDACPLGIRVITAEGDLFYANKAILDMFGYATIEELENTPKEQLYTEASFTGHIDRKAKRIKGEDVPSEYEINIKRADGEVRTLQVFRREITWGGKQQFLAMYEDITERRKLEASLRLNTQLVQSISDAIISSDEKYRINSWNKAAEEMYGWSAAEVMGKTVMEFTSPVFINTTYQEILNELGSNGYWKGEAIHHRRNGEEIYVLMTISLLKDEQGNDRGAVTVFRDITNWKNAEQEIKHRESFLNSVLENTPSPLWVSDAKGTVIRMNQALRDLLNLKDEEIVGKYSVLKDTQVIEQGLLPLVKSVYEEGKTVSFTRNYWRSRQIPPDSPGNMRHVLETVISAVKNQQGQVTNAICQEKDITERLKLEASLRLNTQLVQNISDAIIACDDKYRVTSWNKAAEEMYGWSAAEAMGKTIMEVTGPSLIPSTHEEILKELKTNGYWRGEAVHHRRNGEQFYVLKSISRLRDEKGIGIGSVTVFKDITDRKKAEKALVESRQRFFGAFHSSPSMNVIVLRNSGAIIEVNDTFCQVSGYSREEIIGNRWADLNFWYNPEQLIVISKELSQKGVITNTELPFRTKNGDIRYFNGNFTKLDLENEPYIFASGMDVTERKNAEKALAESRQRFSGAFHYSPSMNLIINRNSGVIIEVNDAFCHVTGYIRDEVIGKRWKDLNFWNDAEQQNMVTSELNQKGVISNKELGFRMKNGEIRFFNSNFTMLNIENQPYIFGSGIDVTARKEGEERINNLNQALRSIRNINQLITREKTRDRLIQSVCDNLVMGRSFNSAWIILFDDNRQPVTRAGSNIERGLDELVALFRKGEMPHCVRKALTQNQVIVTSDPQQQCPGCPVLGKTVGTGSMTVRLETDGVLYGILCGSMRRSVLIDDDEISLFSEVAADISFALRDIELSSSHDLLLQEQLRTSKLESIGTLAGGIAHDFNNLLTGIMGNIGLAKSFLGPDSEAIEVLDEAEKAAVRSRELTQQLLTFARGGKPIKKLANIAAVIKDSATFALRGSKAKLELSLPPDLWFAEADEGQIGQVIHNLVINADEAMSSGGTLIVTAENLSIRRPGSLPLSNGNYIQIDIRDTGVGISPENLQKIFEPYFTTKQKGSGLGLTSAYSIIKSHGGYLMAESILNQGSVFHIYLPASRKTAKGEKKVTAKKSTQAGGKVLVMDDDEIIRKMLKNMLNLAGYEAETTPDGAEAVLKYQEAMKNDAPFSAVIMDLTVPGGMGGKEATAKLLEMDPEASVIVSSGYATDPIMSDYKKYGFSAVIAKPYSIRQLQETLAELITLKKK